MSSVHIALIEDLLFLEVLGLECRPSGRASITRIAVGYQDSGIAGSDGY